MKWHERIAMVRRYGPPSPTLRHVLEVLVSYDDDAGRFVWPGNARLARETGLTGRCIQASLSKLVRAGWLQPEKEPRESRPTAKPGHEAWWAHGNTGGRKNSTRYRITYQTETRNDVPKQPGTTFRDREASESETRNDVPETRNDVPLNPERRSGDPPVSIQEQRGGDTPSPTPLPHKDTCPWGTADRHAIQAAMKQEGADIRSTADLEAWEGIAQQIGVQQAREVCRVMFDLRKFYAAEWGRDAIRPHLAQDVAPFVTLARRALDARRAFDERMKHRKETA